MSSDYAYETSGPQWVDLREMTSNDSLSNDDFFDRTHDSLEASPVRQNSQLRKSTRLQNKITSTVKSSEVNDSDKSELQSAFIDDIDNICITPLKLKSPNTNNKETCLKEYHVNEILSDAIEGLKLASSIKKRPKPQNMDKPICPKIEIIPDTPTQGKVRLLKSLQEMTLNKQNQMTNDLTPVKKIINVRRSVRNLKNDLTPKNMSIQNEKLSEHLTTKQKANTINKIEMNLENKMTEELDNIKENIQSENIMTKNKNLRASDCYSSIKNADVNLVKKKLRICRSMHQNTPINRTPVFNLKISPCTMTLKSSKIPVYKLDSPDIKVSEIDQNISLKNDKKVSNKLQKEFSNNQLETINSVESNVDDYNEEELPNINDVNEDQQINIPEIESQADVHDDYVETEFQPFDEFSKSLDEDENQYQVFKSQFTQKTLRGLKKTTILTGQARRQSIQMKNILTRRRTNKYVSLAEGIKAFQRSTPTRFHTVSKNTEGYKKSKVNQKTTQHAFKRTIPISPNWHSKIRIKKVTQDQEQKKQTNTKNIIAQKVSITTSKDSKPQNEVLKKRITIPKPFKLSEPKKKTESSQSLRVTAPKTDKIVPQKPISQKAETQKILHSSIPVTRDFNISSKLEPKKIRTQPVPFLFEQRNKKATIEKEQKMKKLQDEKLKINEKSSAISINKLSNKDSKNQKENGIKTSSHIKVMPFSFEERDRLLAKKKEEMRKKIEDQENKSRVFHANPVPHFKPIKIKVPSRENLNSNNNFLRTKSVENFQSKNNIKDPNILRARSNDNFKYSKRQNSKEAIPVQKIKPIGSSSSLNVGEHNKVTDMPKLKPKLKPLNIELHSEKRARLRREYEEKLKLRSAQEEARRRREKEMKLAKEQEEIAKLRKQAEHKARPVPVYKPLVIAKSTRPITEPQSPAWTQSRR